MKNVAMRDKLGHALDKLSVVVSICASDADLNSCHDGLALLTDDVFADVAEVLQSLEDESNAEKASA